MKNKDLKGAIVLPAGSGKTTLSQKYKNLHDIDSFHTPQDRKNLRKLYQEVKISQDWDKYNRVEMSLINHKINNLKTPYILLLHSKEKADLLNIPYLGSGKTSKRMMEKIASQRGEKDKLREQMTHENWKYTQAPIFNSHDDIHENILNLANKNNIYLEPCHQS